MDLTVILRLMYLTFPITNVEVMQTNRIRSLETQPHPLYLRLYLTMLLVHYWHLHFIILSNDQRSRQVWEDGVTRYYTLYLQPPNLLLKGKNSPQLCPQQLLQDIIIIQHRTTHHPYPTIVNITRPISIQRQVESIMIFALLARKTTGVSISTYYNSSCYVSITVMCLRDMVSGHTMKDCISGVPINVLSINVCLVARVVP